MTAVLEMKALIDRGPWNDVIRTIAKNNGEKRVREKSPEVNADCVRYHRVTTKSASVKDDSYRHGSPNDQDADSKRAASLPCSVLSSSMKQLNASSSTVSIGFSIARILGNSIITSRSDSYDFSNVKCRQLTAGPQSGGDSSPTHRTSSDSSDCTSSTPCDGRTSTEVHRTADFARARRSPQHQPTPEGGRPSVILSHSLSARRQFVANRKRSVDGVSDDGERHVEDDDDEDEMDDDESDNHTDIDVEYDLKKDNDSDDATGFHHDEEDDERFAIKNMHRRPLGDLPDCISGFEKLTWLQCTRYKPPKLPRSKKLRDGLKKRKLGRNPRVPFTQHQVAMLEHKFNRTHYLSSVDVAELSATLNLTENRVKIWFQNRRARERRNKDPQILASEPTSDVNEHSPPSDAHKACMNRSSMSPSPIPSPLHQQQHTHLRSGYRSSTLSSDLFRRDDAHPGSLVGYPEMIMRQFNSSTRGAFPMPYFPPPMRQLPAGLRLHNGYLMADGGAFAADLLAHLHQSSSSFASSSAHSAAAASAANNVVIALSGMGTAPAAGVIARPHISTCSSLRGFMR